MTLQQKTKNIETVCRTYIDKKEEVLANRKIYLDEREQIMSSFLQDICQYYEVRIKGIKSILGIK